MTRKQTKIRQFNKQRRSDFANYKISNEQKIQNGFSQDDFFKVGAHSHLTWLKEKVNCFFCSRHDRSQRRKRETAKTPQVFLLRMNIIRNRFPERTVLYAIGLKGLKSKVDIQVGDSVSHLHHFE